MNDIAIDVNVLMDEVPYLSLIVNQNFTWDELGAGLNLVVQGRAPQNNASMGRNMSFSLKSVDPPKDYWEAVKREVFALFCTNSPKYSTIRKKFNEKKHPATIYILTTITAWLADKIGVAPAMLTPLVATVLYAIAQMGKNAWCGLVKGRMQI